MNQLGCLFLGPFGNMQPLPRQVSCKVSEFGWAH